MTDPGIPEMEGTQTPEFGGKHIITARNSCCGKVMFFTPVRDSVHGGGGGGCEWQGDMHTTGACVAGGWGWYRHAWQERWPLQQFFFNFICKIIIDNVVYGILIWATWTIALDHWPVAT